MALATKCPHCSTIFRVAHDQLKLRGGIVRCGSCNEVFDGNAALLEPLAAPAPAVSEIPPSPPPAPFDEPVAALDSRAVEDASGEPIYTLELDTALDGADSGQFDEPVAEAVEEESAAPEPEPETTPEPETALEPEPETAPAPEPETTPEPEPEPVEDAQPATIEPAPENPLDIKPMTHEELEAALAAELALIEQSIAADAAAEPKTAAASTTAAERREPTLDPDSRYDLEETDEEALVQLAAARERDTTPEIHTLLRAASAPPQDRFDPPADRVAKQAEEEAEPPAEEAEADDPNEPGFVKRDRRRERYGKTITIAMSVGSLLLLGALAAQGLTTFRNQLAASYPALKPALQDICGTLGCKIELPTQIDELVIEQGELQTLSETTFSFSTLLRNQGATAQTWPHIELVLDDANDKAILRRVFTPRDYLGAGATLEKGFAPRSEQSVKLYFELKQLKASGYHIAVFYP